MNINLELIEHGLQQVENFEYKVRDCLFDSIAYLINYWINSKLIRKNNMCYLQQCNNWYASSIGVFSTWIIFKKFAWFASWRNNGWNYLYKKMLLPTLNGRLLADFIVIHWILEYLQHPIHIWNKKNYQIIMKVWNENASHVLSILYANNHFKPIITYDPIINYSNIHTCDAYDTKFKNYNINNENNEVQLTWKMFSWSFEIK